MSELITVPGSELTLTIVEYPWHFIQLESADGTQPYVPQDYPTFAIQEQNSKKYFYWAYVTPYVTKVLAKIAETWNAESMKHFYDRPVKVSGRYRQ